MKNQLPKVKLGVYRNYKNHDYEVVGIGTQTETREIYVVYKALYETPGYDENALWIRPYDMFISNVVVNGKEVPRFEYIGNND